MRLTEEVGCRTRPFPFEPFFLSALWCSEPRVHVCMVQAARAALAEVEVSIARQQEGLERRSIELASQLQQLHVVKESVERDQRQVAFDRAELKSEREAIEGQRS